MGQMPSATDGGTSVAWTVTVNGVMTVGTESARECALGSRHGFVGEGFALDGQSNVAICCTVVPGAYDNVIIFGAGANEAVTD